MHIKKDPALKMSNVRQDLEFKQTEPVMPSDKGHVQVQKGRDFAKDPANVDFYGKPYEGMPSENIDTANLHTHDKKLLKENKKAMKEAEKERAKEVKELEKQREKEVKAEKKMMDE
jgi:hypothetical protein